jgi:hypothetical protein
MNPTIEIENHTRTVWKFNAGDKALTLGDREDRQRFEDATPGSPVQKPDRATWDALVKVPTQAKTLRALVKDGSITVRGGEIPAEPKAPVKA